MAVLLLLAGSPAAADPDPTPAQIEQEINDAWNQLEPLIEQYNGVHTQLLQTQAKIDVIQQQMSPLELRLDLAMARVGALSAQLYELGPEYQLAGLLSSSSPDTLVDQLSLLNQIAAAQNDQLADAAALRDEYAKQKQPLDELKATLAKQDADLAAQKATIEAQMTQLQKLRLAAYGPDGGASGNLKPVACPQEYYGDPGSIAAKKACSLIGKPYVWGAAGPSGYDCSGLTLTAWKAAGVSLDHYTKLQWGEGKPVSRADLRPGDLIFWYSDLHHMGIYVGNGWFVHAPHTGDHVRMGQLASSGMPVAGYRRPG